MPEEEVLARGYGATTVDDRALKFRTRSRGGRGGNVRGNRQHRHVAPTTRTDSVR
jgi:hypothetical protein